MKGLTVRLHPSPYLLHEGEDGGHVLVVLPLPAPDRTVVVLVDVVVHVLGKNRNTENNMVVMNNSNLYVLYETKITRYRSIPSSIIKLISITLQKVRWIAIWKSNSSCSSLSGPASGEFGSFACTVLVAGAGKDV